MVVTGESARLPAVAIGALLISCSGEITGPVGAVDGDVSGADGDVSGADGGTQQAGADASAASTDLEFCVEETNRYREMEGRPPLEHSEQLEEYANEGARIDTEMESAHHHFSSTNGGGIALAENECPSFLGWTIMGDVRSTIAACIQDFYSEGPGGGHYENLMGSYSKLGCGVYVEGNGITIVQDFGN